MPEEGVNRLAREVTTHAGSRITLSYPNRISPPDSGAKPPPLALHTARKVYPTVSVAPGFGLLSRW